MIEAPKRPLQVFLCHASGDKPAVRALYRRLKADGISAWLDEEDLDPGDDWQRIIPNAVEHSDVVIVCLSRKSVNKEGYVQKEIAFALNTADEKPEGTIYIIPAKLEECDVPQRLRRWQWVDLAFDGSSFDQHSYDKLMRSLRRRANSIGATLELPKAPAMFEHLSGTNTRPPTIKKQGIEKKIKQSHQPMAKLLLRQRWGLAIMVAVLGIAIAIFGMAFGLPLLTKPLQSLPTKKESIIPKLIQHTLTATLFATKTAAVTPSNTLTSTPTLYSLTSTITPTGTPYPLTITEKGAKMALIPAGTFTMGISAKQKLAECQKYIECSKSDQFSDEVPAHQVSLPAFYMDIYEVTNVLYKACEDAGGCLQPTDVSSSNYKNYYGNILFDNYPVVNIDWYRAKAYCQWRGLLTISGETHLPTEAEWEKAARSTDGRRYPWGNNTDPTRAYYNRDYEDVISVASFERGKSPYGIYNMAGNVFEWVADWYDKNYYATLGENTFNPQGPLTGQYKVIRGGSVWSSIAEIRSANRKSWLKPTESYVGLGFRCARSVP